jgi:hypothetical protein
VTWPRAAAAALGAAVVLAGCATPAFDHGAYVQNAKAALESAVSEARTAELAASARLDEQATKAYADTVITDSEGALGPIQTSFGGVDPPSRDDDALRAEVLSQLGDVEDALAEARIAVRRDDRPALASTRDDLADLADQLEQTRAGLP